MPLEAFMVAVSITSEDLTASGVTPTRNARVEFSHIRAIVDSGILTTRPVSVKFEGGAATFAIPITPLDNALRIRMTGVNGYGSPKFFQVPDLVSVTWAELIADYQVDPDTLDPEVDAPAAWYAQLDALLNGIDGGNASSIYTATYNFDGGSAAA